LTDQRNGDIIMFNYEYSLEEFLGLVNDGSINAHDGHIEEIVVDGKTSNISIKGWLDCHWKQQDRTRLTLEELRKLSKNVVIHWNTKMYKC
jgi:hypothetical protein